jgi:hypothetical protein
MPYHLRRNPGSQVPKVPRVPKVPKVPKVKGVGPPKPVGSSRLSLGLEGLTGSDSRVPVRYPHDGSEGWP